MGPPSSPAGIPVLTAPGGAVWPGQSCAPCPPCRGPSALLSPGRVLEALAPVGGTRRPGDLRGGALLVTWCFVTKTKTRWLPAAMTIPPVGRPTGLLASRGFGWATAAGDTSSSWPLSGGSHLRGQVPGLTALCPLEAGPRQARPLGVLGLRHQDGPQHLLVPDSQDVPL